MQEAPNFGATPAGRVPDPDTAAPAILAEATAQLRGNLLDLVDWRVAAAMALRHAAAPLDQYSMRNVARVS